VSVVIRYVSGGSFELIQASQTPNAASPDQFSADFVVGNFGNNDPHSLREQIG